MARSPEALPCLDSARRLRGFHSRTGGFVVVQRTVSSLLLVLAGCSSTSSARSATETTPQPVAAPAQPAPAEPEAAAAAKAAEAKAAAPTPPPQQFTLNSLAQGAVLLPGLGEHKRKVTTSSAEAQAVLRSGPGARPTASTTTRRRARSPRPPRSIRAARCASGAPPTRSGPTTTCRCSPIARWPRGMRCGARRPRRRRRRRSSRR